MVIYYVAKNTLFPFQHLLCALHSFWWTTRFQQIKKIISSSEFDLRCWKGRSVLVCVYYIIIIIIIIIIINNLLNQSPAITIQEFSVSDEMVLNRICSSSLNETIIFSASPRQFERE